MILGRTLEEFTIPNGYSGKLEGRSTYARLGLAIHCTGDFINPGWRGRMPLQLVNFGKSPIILTPYIHICQLLVTQVSSKSDKPYGTEAGHKYNNDDGGPSKYWWDVSLAKLRQSINREQIPQQIQADFMKKFGTANSELVDKFADFVGSLPPDKITNAREIIEEFADYDTKKQTRKKLWWRICRWLPVVPITVSLGALFKQPYGPLHWIFWAITAVLFPFAVWGQIIANEPRQPFTRRDVEEQFA
jgi:hypothetical protein